VPVGVLTSPRAMTPSLLERAWKALLEIENTYPFGRNGESRHPSLAGRVASTS
jgi:hypothetical protein